MSETRSPLPPEPAQTDPEEPGQPERYDCEYQREGVCNLFMFFEPKAGLRHVSITDQRTAVDYAHQMQYLVDEHSQQAIKIAVVEDNLNTHTPASKTYPKIFDSNKFKYSTNLVSHNSIHYC